MMIGKGRGLGVWGLGEGIRYVVIPTLCLVLSYDVQWVVFRPGLVSKVGYATVRGYDVLKDVHSGHYYRESAFMLYVYEVIYDNKQRTN